MILSLVLRHTLLPTLDEIIQIQIAWELCKDSGKLSQLGNGEEIKM